MLDEDYNYLSDQIELFRSYLNECKSDKTFKELFNSLKDGVIENAGLVGILLFQKTNNDFTLIYKDFKNVVIPIEMLKNDHAKDILNYFKEYGFNEKTIKIQKIQHGNEVVFILIFIHTSDYIISSYELDLINLFTLLLEQKVLEQKVLEQRLTEERVKAFQNVISEKAVLLNENLTIQNLIVDKLREIISKNVITGAENDDIKQLKYYFELFCQQQEVIINQITTLGYYADIPLTPSIYTGEELLEEFSFYLQLHEPEIYLKPKDLLVKVDLELFTEALKQAGFIVKSLIPEKEKKYKVKIWEDTEYQYHIYFYHEKINPDWIGYIEKQEKRWNRKENTPLISTQILLSFRLLQKLLKKNKCVLVTHETTEDTEKKYLKGLKIIIKRYIENEEYD